MSVSQSAIARVLGVNVEFRDFNLGQARFLPQRIVIIGQGSTAVTYPVLKEQIFSSSFVGDKYGYGSPLHLASKQFFPDNGDGIQGIPVSIIPVVDGTTASDGDVTVTGTATAAGSIKAIIGGIETAEVPIAVGDLAADIAADLKAAIDAVLDMPATTGTIVTATIPLTAKWQGESGDQITIELEQTAADGITLGFTAFASGAGNPDVSVALAKVGDIWETFILNCMNYDDTVSLAAYSAFGEGRWNQLVKKPCVVASGCVDDFATRTAITDARKTDRVNFLIQSTGSRELPFVIAARGLVKDIVPTANDRPAKNYEGLLTGLEAGADSAQEDYNTRDAALKLGASTNIKTDGVAELADIVTFYHPTGQTNPAYRYVKDIVKLMNVLFNVEIILASFKSNPLAPDETITLDPDAVQPKDVKAVLSNLADSLAGGRSVIIVDPAFTKANLTASINGTNPNRLDSTFPVKLSGNVEVNSNDIYFGFFFGSAA